jgi:hypothetical protein
VGGDGDGVVATQEKNSVHLGELAHIGGICLALERDGKGRITNRLHVPRAPS